MEETHIKNSSQTDKVDMLAIGIESIRIDSHVEVNLNLVMRTALCDSHQEINN